ncbi:MAG: hypothetical protein RIC14_05535 [Filomicrobium sp.]
MNKAEKMELPYGIWVCADGTLYLFNRKYQPIWYRAPGAAVAKPANRSERVPFVNQVWLWDDDTDIAHNAEVANAMRKFLTKFKGD